MMHSKKTNPISKTGSERIGISVAGNLLNDIVKTIRTYPEKGMLSNISSISRAVGGCVPNVGMDLAAMDPSLPLIALGRVGEDESGAYVLSELSRSGMDVSFIKKMPGVSTGFSDVMTVESTGERTFFHHKGANSFFVPEDVPLEALPSRMLHIGYILLLDSFDAPDRDYGTVMAGFLKTVQDAGIKTSIDVVSDTSGKFAEKVIPSLKYTDNAIMNEIEGCAAAGLSPRDENGKLIIPHIRASMEKLLSCGVRERVILHCPEAGFIASADGKFLTVPSLSLEPGYIKGTVGAGDAFCAGCLYGIYHSYQDEDILSFASGAAALSLSEKDSVSGMKSKDTIWECVQSHSGISLS